LKSAEFRVVRGLFNVASLENCAETVDFILDILELVAEGKVDTSGFFVVASFSATFGVFDVLLVFDLLVGTCGVTLGVGSGKGAEIGDHEDVSFVSGDVFQFFLFNSLSDTDGDDGRLFTETGSAYSDIIGGTSISKDEDKVGDIWSISVFFGERLVHSIFESSICFGSASFIWDIVDGGHE
jgi:hypothetical protein